MSKRKIETRNVTCICPFRGCAKQKMLSDVELRRHLTSIHEITVNAGESHTFPSLENYKLWQEKLEEDNGVCYKKIRDFITKNGIKITHFRCASGEISQICDGILVQKDCPSSISLYDKGKGDVGVLYFPSHFGHNIRLSTLNRQPPPNQSLNNTNRNAPTSAIRDSSKMKAIASIPMASRHSILFQTIHAWKHVSAVASSIRSLSSSVKRAKLSLTAAMDLARECFFESNIDAKLYRNHREAFENVRENYKRCHERQNLKPRNELKSLISKLRELKDKNPLYFEKIVNDKDSAKETFQQVFVIINPIQVKLLKEVGHNGVVCVDIILGFSDFNIMCVNVIDSFGESFPCAICVSNRENSAIARKFFSVIKSKTGTIAPRIFICQREEFYVQWKSVMMKAEQLYLGSWLIDAACRSLVCKLTISSEDKLDLYVMLRNLIDIPAVAQFEKQVELIKDLLPEFYLKIERYLLSKAKLWAKCYRDVEVRNCDWKLELTHLEMCAFRLSKEFVGGNKLDSLIFSILDFVKGKCCERLTRLDQCLQTRLAAQGHADSFSNGLRVECLSENQWIVENKGENFRVWKTNFPPCNDCKYSCAECDHACIHKFACSCLDNLIRFHLCSHIHLVARFNVKQQQQQKKVEMTEECNQCLAEIVLVESLKMDIKQQLIKFDTGLQLLSLTDVETLTVIKESFKLINKMIEENNPDNNNC